MVDWACAASLGAGMPSGDLAAENAVSVGESKNAREATERNTGGVGVVGAEGAHGWTFVWWGQW